MRRVARSWNAQVGWLRSALRLIWRKQIGRPNCPTASQTVSNPCRLVVQAALASQPLFCRFPPSRSPLNVYHSRPADAAWVRYSAVCGLLRLARAYDHAQPASLYANLALTFQEPLVETRRAMTAKLARTVGWLTARGQVRWAPKGSLGIGQGNSVGHLED